MKSAMEFRHASFFPFAAAALSTIAATSTVSARGALGAAVGAARAWAELCPKIAPLMLPKIPVTFTPLMMTTNSFAV
jgi:hypothetical protein